jgi:hypothetical protein
MSFVRWLRKNNMKLMAIVVIVLMFVFVAGDFLAGWGRRQANTRTVGYLGKQAITNDKMMAARQELDLLRMLRADDLLRAQDLQGVFLAELLFTNERGSAELYNRIKSTIRRNLYAISSKQIDDIYRRQLPPHIYWYCLKTEAQRAGIAIPNDQVGELLGKAIPQLFKGQTYSGFMSAMMSQQRLVESDILSTMGELLAVLQYAQMMCSDGALTNRQIRVEAADQQESLDAELVEFDAKVFAKNQEPPGDEAIRQHFDKYKAFAPGSVSEKNPYGFGYELPPLVRLEYIAVKLQDVQKIVTPPTQDEVGDYYERNKADLYTEQVRSDPNDPNSAPVSKTKSFAEVADTISKQLQTQKINAKADAIMQNARTLTEAGLGDLDTQTATTEQFKAKAGDYEAVANQLSKKYKIKVYAGRTGLLSPTDVQMDDYLGMLFVRGNAQNPVRLGQVVFGVQGLEASELGPFDVPRPKLYQNIGPAKDLMSGTAATAQRIEVLVRVVEAHKAAEPENVDVTFSTQSLQLDPNEQKPEEHTYSVKQKVVEDLKNLAAMTTAHARAEEFLTMAGKDGWEKATGAFESLYGEKDPNKPDVFRLQNLVGLRRMSQTTLQTLAMQWQGDPAMKRALNDTRKNQLFVDKLYALVPADANTAKTLPIVEFKPDMQYLAINNITVKQLWKQDFEKTKAMQVFREEHAQAESLAVIHFNPENILRRMHFRRAGPNGKPIEPNAPTQSEAAS